MIVLDQLGGAQQMLHRCQVDQVELIVLRACLHGTQHSLVERDTVVVAVQLGGGLPPLVVRQRPVPPS
eukprot:3418360-Pyramimonas_sp.AAC.1